MIKNLIKLKRLKMNDEEYRKYVENMIRIPVKTVKKGKKYRGKKHKICTIYTAPYKSTDEEWKDFKTSDFSPRIICHNDNEKIVYCCNEEECPLCEHESAAEICHHPKRLEHIKQEIENGIEMEKVYTYGGRETDTYKVQVVSGLEQLRFFPSWCPLRKRRNIRNEV